MGETSGQQDLAPIFNIPDYDNKPKYQKFRNFLENKSEIKREYHTCNEKDVNALMLINNVQTIDAGSCIGCLSCLVANPDFANVIQEGRLMSVMIPMFGSMSEVEKITAQALNYFHGSPASLPRYSILNRKYSSFEKFTEVDEVMHLAIWSIIALWFLSSDKNARTGKEIEIRSQNPRDGRLDVCVFSNNRVAVGEAKVSLEKLLAEGRYRVQMANYKSECLKFIHEFNRVHSGKLELDLFLLIGGSETDLFPPNHPMCTSLVGNRAKIFYDHIVQDKIRFVSANALWALTMMSITSRKKICWDLLFPKIFRDANCIGLLSAGVVIKRGGDFLIEKIDQKILEESSIPIPVQSQER